MKKAVLIKVAILVLPAFQFIYGFKCVVFQEGQLIAHIKTLGSFSVPVLGAAAIASGFSNMGIALFLILSLTDPPTERLGWIWRFLREVVRWGGVVGGIGYAIKARQLAGLVPSWQNLSLQNGPGLLLLAALPFAVLLAFLAVIFWAMIRAGYKSIKQDLCRNGLELVRARARPLSYWGQASGLVFRVVYIDENGFTHRALCSVSMSRLDSVQWFKDEIDAIEA